MTEPLTPAQPGESVEPAEGPRSLRVIAREIRQNWSKVNYAAEPYLAAMGTMNTVQDDYGYDNGASIVRYFLANAGGWRGDVARRVKAELKAMVS